MKNLSVVLNVVLLIAVGVLYVLHFTGRKSSEMTGQTVDKEAASETEIVYINTDTLMSHYLLAMELNEAFMKKQEDRRTELNIKAKDLDREANDFQRKLQNNGFISEARATEARDQILGKQQKLQQLQQEMTDKMMREQNELNKRLFDSVTSFLGEYNKEKGYNIILSTTLGGNVLFAQDGFDITGEVVKGLNANYNEALVK